MRNVLFLSSALRYYSDPVWLFLEGQKGGLYSPGESLYVAHTRAGC